MEKKSKIIMIAALVAVVVLAVVLLVCGSKSHKIKNLEKAQAKFEKYVAKVEKKELTGEETSRVNELKGECKGYFAQAKARMILQDFNDAVEEAGDEVKGVIESMK